MLIEVGTINKVSGEIVFNQLWTIEHVTVLFLIWKRGHFTCGNYACVGYRGHYGSVSSPDWISDTKAGTLMFGL